MPRILVLLLLILSESASARQVTYPISYPLSSSIQNGTVAPIQNHEGPGEFDNYLAMNLPFQPILELRQQVTETEGLNLKSRGEAHITVVSPVEYWNALRPLGISMSEIDSIARSMRIQNSRFSVLCLGRGQTSINGNIEQTVFIVVQSLDLLKIRQAIQSIFISKGGRQDQFSAHHFYPHITVGFTSRDLFETDGVTKGIESCANRIEMTDRLPPSQNGNIY